MLPSFEKKVVTSHEMFAFLNLGRSGDMDLFFQMMPTDWSVAVALQARFVHATLSGAA